MPPPGTGSAERDTVLVFGAGASYGARPEVECGPPLGTALAAYLLQWLEVNRPRRRVGRLLIDDDDEQDAPDSRLWDDYKELRPILEQARDSGEPNAFELALADLGNAGRVGLLDSLNRILAVSFLGGKACAFREGEDLYDRLFRAFGARLRAIVTPNYDLLAEEALHRVGVPPWHAGTTNPPASVAVYKIHGSVNFAQVPGGAGGATLETAQRNMKSLQLREQRPFASGYNAHPLYTIAGSHRNVFLHQNDVGRYRPVMVTYGPAKPAVWGLPYLERIREACRADLEGSPPHKIIAVGIRPPLDDSGADDPTWLGLCRLFEGLPSSKAYWSGNVGERNEMARFGFVGRDGWFADLVKSVESGVE
jgi:hypothetical protein